MAQEVVDQRSVESYRAAARQRYLRIKKRKETEAIRDRLTEAIEIVQWDWTLSIVRNLSNGPMRLNDLEIKLGASSESLRKALVRMRDNGLVISTRYNEVPPRVDYELTERGRGLVAVIYVLAEWAG